MAYSDKVIEHYNRLDREFYRCARKEFDRKVAAIRTEETTRLYGKYVEALELYRRTNQGNQYASPLRWREGTG